MFLHNDPWPWLSQWMAEAAETEPRVPDAMQLATVGADGNPTVRTVLLKAFGPTDGLVFYTNLGSRKALELGEVPRAAACLHWKGLERQVLARGPVQSVADAQADAYWATRPRGSQLGAWASRQSQTVPSEVALTDALAEVTTRFEGRDVPRPEFWGGFRILPDELEFWQGRPDRLHQRAVFTRNGEGWTRSLRYP